MLFNILITQQNGEKLVNLGHFWEILEGDLVKHLSVTVTSGRQPIRSTAAIYSQ